MLDWNLAIVLVAVLWLAQVAGTAMQARHLRVMLRSVTRDWNEGYAVFGSSRSFLGAGAVVMLVLGRDLVVRDAHAMQGRTVLARLRRDPALVGMTLDQLRQGVPAVGPRKLLAIKAAVGQADRMRAGADAGGCPQIVAA